VGRVKTIKIGSPRERVLGYLNHEVRWALTILLKRASYVQVSKLKEDARGSFIETREFAGVQTGYTITETRD
jgi:hypothetical protein